MKKLYKNSLFIFRRDLRLIDNTALNEALTQSTNVIPCFIFDPRQVSNQNTYKSNNAIQFMIQSLQELQDTLEKQRGNLYIFHGKTENIVESLICKKIIDALFINRDYTPFSSLRDNAIKTICIAHNIPIIECNDSLLNEPEKIKKSNNTHYSIFSAFYKKSLTFDITKPTSQYNKNWFTNTIKNSSSLAIIAKKILPKNNTHIAISGGRSEGMKKLRNLITLKDYSQEHNYPAIHTSFLSAHLKFGTISIRETYHKIKGELGISHPLLRQLYWRDFFTHIAYHVPKVFGCPYKERYKHLVWNSNKTLFKRWYTGQTGFPIIDAGMRELNTTGFMHNRVRMIVASFLVKDLHINWLWGEKYFAQKLVDYDPAVNNGNWQWCASTGCDAQPYFRIFNPWLQQKTYDPDCVYIKKWIPELKSYDNKIIHNLFKNNSPTIKDYPRPIVNHQKESNYAKKLYQKNSKTRTI